MEVQTAQHQPMDWANDAFDALVSHNMQADKWAHRMNSPFTIPPSVLSQASIERYGQVTPPEDLSPASQAQDAREGSIPVDQLRNETLWPQGPQQNQTVLQKRPRKPRAANQSQAADNTPPQEDANANPQPPKRKRGRPKSQPQMVEAYTADGFPLQVSSARQSHLEKNRVAAHKCRQRKKEYINSLEGRAREFSSKNKALKSNVAMLREEVLELKNEVLRHAGCGFWAVDEYLARCAGDLLGMEAPRRTLASQPTSLQQSPALHGSQLMGQRHDSSGSLPSQGIMSQSSSDADDFGGLELLEDFDNDLEDLDEPLE